MLLCFVMGIRGYLIKYASTFRVLSLDILKGSKQVLNTQKMLSMGTVSRGQRLGNSCLMHQFILLGLRGKDLC